MNEIAMKSSVITVTSPAFQQGWTTAVTIVPRYFGSTKLVSNTSLLLKKFKI